MKEEFKNYQVYLDSFHFSNEEQEAINKLNTIRSYKKGSLLLREGEVSTKSFYIISGCVRQYYVKDGEEKTTNFFIEQESITPATNMTNLTPSSHYLECLEDTDLTYATDEQTKDICDKFPRLGEMCRENTEFALSEHHQKFAKFIMSSPEERYIDLLENRPNLLNRVPQYQLASYIGITPESLSRIRKRLVSKK